MNDDRFVPASIVQSLHAFYPDVNEKYPSVLRRWKDLRTSVEGLLSMGLPLEKHLYDQQVVHACRELGLRWPGTWQKDDTVKIKTRLRSPDFRTLQDAQDLHLSYKDCIVVRAVSTESNFWIPGALASMEQRDNVMTLFPCFFAERFVDSLRDSYIEPGMTDVRSLVDNRTLTVLHEVEHSPSSIAGKTLSL